ncbi:hypothetical protein CHARACLAT_021563 [Characodon lateralis]|uniref:Uncharacterized protein n=1 Tax=Characodon lateralis TaxID=208331 RepID=A0ABU7EBP9_9TELE|nr:hypothetical protein [Characodon lateralis]
MSVLRWHRLSALWKNWMFNQEPAEEQAQIPETLGHEEEPRKNEGSKFKDSSPDCENLIGVNTQNSGSEQNRDVINLNVVHEVPKTELLKRSCSEPCPQVSNHVDRSYSCRYMPDGCGPKSHRTFHSEKSVNCALQVDNGTEGDDSFLQRDGSQRRSRRRFRRVNPRGERELITDGQEPASYNNTVSVLNMLADCEAVSSERCRKRLFSGRQTSDETFVVCYLPV